MKPESERIKELFAQALEKKSPAEIHTRDVKFVQPGVTTCADVVARLGTPSRKSCRVSVLAYSWEIPMGRGVWWWFVAVPEVGGGDFGEVEWSRWRAWFVTFDDDGIVHRKEFVRLSQRASLDEQLERWARRARHQAEAVMRIRVIHRSPRRSGFRVSARRQGGKEGRGSTPQSQALAVRGRCGRSRMRLDEFVGDLMRGFASKWRIGG
jgi:hypothetical protein